MTPESALAQRTLVVAPQFAVAIENVLMIKARDREERRFRVRSVGQAMHAIVTRAMTFVTLIVADYRSEIADLECLASQRS